MNKVTCNLCGTSYPENATQCPICGYVRSAEVSSENSGNGTYTYVKGGRFSKANVKKRNRSAGTVADPVVTSKVEIKDEKKKSKGLIVLMIVLLLAIVLVLGYIAVQFLLPDSFFSDMGKKPSSSQQNEVNQPTLENVTPSTEAVQVAPNLACTSITLNPTEIQFDAIGAKVKLSATLAPADTTDQLSFTSSDASVASVSADGTITAVAEGSAVITVTCGSVRVECNVTCTVPTQGSEQENTSFALNRKEITFNQEGQTWMLYDGDIPVEEIVWSSDDNDVATIADGKVAAVSNGDTTVYGIYEGQTVSCIIHCDFSATGESGGFSEADGTANRLYKLYNPVGYADDVTIYVGETFPLQLVDENENEVTDAKWVITDESICTYEDGLVEATNVGTTEITATYEGVDYICTVRVIESD